MSPVIPSIKVTTIHIICSAKHLLVEVLRKLTVDFQNFSQLDYFSLLIVNLIA